MRKRRRLPFRESTLIERQERDHSTSTRTLLQGSDLCLPCESPSEEVFIVNFNRALTELNDNGLLNAIDSASSISELEDIGCPNEIKVIETTLAINFEGDPTGVSPEELTMLSN